MFIIKAFAVLFVLFIFPFNFFSCNTGLFDIKEEDNKKNIS